MKDTSSVKPSHLKVGEQGEGIASSYLQENGYEILERNFRFEKAEIDIIAQKGKFLVFVEVKTLTNTQFGMPELAVDKQKEKNISRAALHYIYSQDWKQEIRFDIIAIVIDAGKYQLEHFVDAFH
ncbi:MAG: YraN family protein [Pseudarcicella sp.]|nr:YraN family protein [Pseudarcicella sp.]MBP6410106.1 YraN family protein [Pseudarcicella sp.]